MSKEDQTSQAEGCPYGHSVKSQVKNTWRVLTLIVALITVQIVVSGWAIKAANEATRQVQNQEISTARLDERLQSIQQSIKRIENRMYNDSE